MCCLWKPLNICFSTLFCVVVHNQLQQCWLVMFSVCVSVCVIVTKFLPSSFWWHIFGTALENCCLCVCWKILSAQWCLNCEVTSVMKRYQYVVEFTMRVKEGRDLPRGLGLFINRFETRRLAYSRGCEKNCHWFYKWMSSLYCDSNAQQSDVAQGDCVYTYQQQQHHLKTKLNLCCRKMSSSSNLSIQQQRRTI